MHTKIRTNPALGCGALRWWILAECFSSISSRLLDPCGWRGHCACGWLVDGWGASRRIKSYQTDLETCSMTQSIMASVARKSDEENDDDSQSASQSSEESRSSVPVRLQTDTVHLFQHSTAALEPFRQRNWIRTPPARCGCP